MTHTIDHLFEDDNLLGDPNDLDELVEQRGHRDNNSDQGSDGERGGRPDGEDENSGGEDDENKKKPKKDDEEKKVRRISRPQPKLNPDRLKGPRGLIALPKAFSDFKFRGKGHEAEDLSRMMARMEHWAHRLFPKMQFDDFLEKVEKLGTKKVVQVYVKRLRMGLEVEGETEHVQSDNEEDERPDPSIAEQAMGEFDRLLAEQVSHYQENPPTPRTPAAVAKPTTAQTLTAEQRERIERNRREAMERRMTRLQAQQHAEPQEDNSELTAEQRARIEKSKQLARERREARKMESGDAGAEAAISPTGRPGRPRGRRSSTGQASASDPSSETESEVPKSVSSKSPPSKSVTSEIAPSSLTENPTPDVYVTDRSSATHIPSADGPSESANADEDVADKSSTTDRISDVSTRKVPPRGKERENSATRIASTCTDSIESPSTIEQTTQTKPAGTDSSRAPLVKPAVLQPSSGKPNPSSPESHSSDSSNNNSDNHENTSSDSFQSSEDAKETKKCGNPKAAAASGDLNPAHKRSATGKGGKSSSKRASTTDQLLVDLASDDSTEKLKIDEEVETRDGSEYMKGTSKSKEIKVNQEECKKKVTEID